MSREGHSQTQKDPEEISKQNSRISGCWDKNKEMKMTLSLGLSDWTDGTLSELENEMRNA